MRQTFLHSNWVFKNAAVDAAYVRTAVQYQPWLPATVPGHVHLDLVANGIIADPFERMNELGARWVDECDWTYKCSFDWEADPALPNRVLRFEGLDTVCQILLNGVPLGRFDNMFLPVELGVAGELKEGLNELEVRFQSAVRVGEERRRQYFTQEGLPEGTKQFDERAFVRKAQYMSAWDWGPRLVSCGVWQPVSLIEFAARVLSFSVLQERLENGSFRVRTESKVEGEGEVTLRFGEMNVQSHSSKLEEIDAIVESPQLWWPAGLGEQHLYPASASVSGGNTVSKRIGLRTVALDRSADEVGEAFTFVVNGKKLWARGANWIPNDSFPSRVPPEDYHAQIRQCKALGMNMLRVWGGGLYELEAFYDACDEHGILVWQDFAYACSYYPDGEEASDVARREAEVQVKRLRDRASLALWCGNNENLVMWQTKWGGAASPPRYYGENIYDRVLPEVVSSFDPSHSYIPSSPIGQADREGATANDGKYGDSHYWDVWHGRGDWVYYKDSDTRFSSEFGFASSCSRELWSNAIDASAWDPASPQVRWHDKTGKAWKTFYGYVETHYPSPKSLEDWIYYSQLNQRDALRYGIEHWRRAPTCQGTLIWQFNDCWPVQSWAVQDYLRLLKPAGYELRRLYEDRLISLFREGVDLHIHLVNDGSRAWEGELRVETLALDGGNCRSSEKIPFNIAPGARELVYEMQAQSDPGALVRATAGALVATCLIAEPREAALVAPEYEVEVQEGRVEVKVKGIAVDLVVTDLDGARLEHQGLKLPGTPALTLVNEPALFSCSQRPKRLLLRSLAGGEILAV